MPVLPISVTNFFKDPVKSMLLLTVTAIMYLYIDNRSSYQTIIDKQDLRISSLEARVDTLQNRLLKLKTNHSNGN